MENTDNLKYWIWLSQTLGGTSAFLKLIEYYNGSPGAAASALIENRDKSGACDKMKSEKFTAVTLEAAVEALELCRSSGYDIVSFESPLYPMALRGIKNPPPVLFTKGDPGILRNERRIALVGSRATGGDQLETAFSLSFAIAACGCTVVSGAAAGIDSAAHRGAVLSGKSIAVLGAGLLSLEKGSAARLYGDISENTLYISEFLPDTPAAKYNYPRRNRIISGLSAATAVIGANVKSGALITAECAFSQGRRVLVHSSDNSPGCTELKNAGAEAFSSALEIKELLPELFPEDCAFPLKCFPSAFLSELLKAAGEKTPLAAPEKSPEKPPAQKKEPPEWLSPAAKSVLAAFSDKKTLLPDEITLITGLSASEVMVSLTELELEELIKLLPGNRFTAV